jgi:hypothetical protein
MFDAVTIQEIHEKQLNTAPVPPSLRTRNPISPEMERLLLSCLAKEADARPQLADDLRAQLLACPLAADWPVKARVEWWEAYERMSPASLEATVASASPSMATVSIDLASRIE